MSYREIRDTCHVQYTIFISISAFKIIKLDACCAYTLKSEYSTVMNGFLKTILSKKNRQSQLSLDYNKVKSVPIVLYSNMSLKHK
jgi:hypothetical protein